MSDTNKNKRTRLTDLFRYHRNELSGKERNTFERELQKDPFIEDASDGYASVSPEEALKDIKSLQKRLKTRTGRIQRANIYRIAASIAVLMIISTLFIILEKNKPDKQLAINAAQPETLDIAKNEPVPERVLKEISSEKPVVTPEKKTERPGQKKQAAVEDNQVEAVDNNKIAEAIKDNSISELKTKRAESNLSRSAAPSSALAREKSVAYSVRGTILSSEDNQPVPGANVMIKGTTTGVVTDSGGKFNINLPDTSNRTLVAGLVGMESKEFSAKPDSEIQVKLDPSVSALSEVVVVGYGTKKSGDETRNEDYKPPQPATGKSEFDKYIRENIHRPDTATTGQRAVVVLTFLVRTDGSIDSIRVVRSPGRLFSDEAIRLISSGPSWKPAEDNGRKINDVVRLRVVFR